MKLTFLGTRGLIEAATPRHSRHSALQVSRRGRRVMIDCGFDWTGHVFDVRPEAILLTHAHEDHAHGLRQGAPCPVWATEESWERLPAFPVEQRTMELRRPLDLFGIIFEAFPVQHSVRAPAVGYRITAGRASVFYSPDLVYIRDRAEALAGVRLYIGDGATVTRPFVRRMEGLPCGHAPVSTQLSWCAREGVPKMIVSHCGTEIVTGEEKGILEKIEILARKRGVQVEVAYDGMEIVLR